MWNELEDMAKYRSKQEQLCTLSVKSKKNVKIQDIGKSRPSPGSILNMKAI